ncbi:MAG TPA: glycosyltransferase family 2 protein [Silvibacterium sp.]|nr:glycosyltransferase family 2 protein [Silvibacterium sp.]
MKTNAQRLPVMPTSGGTSWLFWITLSFGFFLAVYTPYELWTEAAQQIDRDGPSLAAFGVYFLGGLAGLMGLRWCILFILSYSTMAKREREELLPSDAELPFVSILAPAYCEAACVKDAMSALVRLDYPAYEVIFVDDGSTDDTHQLALAFAGTHYSEYGRCEVRVFTKPNGGKWSAHNYGLRHASGSLILCIDADSRIETGALKLMVRHMRDKRVGAISGQIRVRNRGSLVGLAQAFEYVLANGALRLSQGATGAVMVVPGPIGLFRREALQRVQAENERSHGAENQAVRGPFSPLTFAEDFHLSLSMLALGYRVEYEPHAIAHTKAPSTLAGLVNQRYRWNRGTMQVVLWFLRRTAQGSKSPLKVSAWIAALFLLDFFCFPPLYFLLLGSSLLFLFHGGSLSSLASWAAAACLVNVMSGSLYAVAHRDNIALSLLSPFFDFYQGILLNCSWLIAMLDQVKGASMRW